MATDTNWLDGLKTGDVVIRCEDRWRYTEETVTRVTPAQVLIGTRRYSKKGGISIPYSMWVPDCICKRTPELLAKVKALKRP